MRKDTGKARVRAKTPEGSLRSRSGMTRASRTRYASDRMAEPSIRDIDALVGPATPHFAYQLRARVRELIVDLPPEHDVRRYGEAKLRLLDDLGHASSKAEGGEKESRERLGWEQIPSSAPAHEPLPRRS